MPTAAFATSTGHLRPDPRESRYLADQAGRTWIPIGANPAFVRAWSDPEQALDQHLGWIDRIAGNCGNYARI